MIFFLGTDRHIYMFDGYEATPISESIYFDNGISDIYMKNINAQQLHKVHAVSYTERHHAMFFVPMTSGEIDSYTKLLLHCDGVDASTTFDDEMGNHTVTAKADAQIDTAQSVFGGASGLFDGTGDYLEIADSDDWDFDSGDFTIDFRCRWNGSLPSNNSGAYIVSQYVNATNFWSLNWFKTVGGVNQIQLHAEHAGESISIGLTFNITNPAADTWYHFALVRDGNNFRCFQDGTQIGSTETDIDDFPALAAVLEIGRRGDPGGYWNGWIDELRISKGIARWTSDFTVPTRAYGGPSNAIAYDYFTGAFWPFDNMYFGASCIADDGTGQRKTYVQKSNYAYLFDDGDDDDGSDINAYWLNKKLDLGSVPTAKRMYQTDIITNSVDFSLTFQQRQNWDSSWSTAKSLTDNQYKHVMKTDRIGNLLQYKFADDSSDTAFKLIRVELTAEQMGIGK